jgi:hypothetical protein
MGIPLAQPDEHTPDTSSTDTVLAADDDTTLDDLSEEELASLLDSELTDLDSLLDDNA